MPLTVVDLCNMALAHLRQRPVTGDADGVIGDTAEASNCRRFYDVALREAHRAFDWPFARQFIQGQKIANAGVPNWRFAYEIPAGVELVRHVVQNDRTEAPVQFKLMRTAIGGADRRAIFCNEDGVWLSCTRYIADPGEYPSDFVEFASLTLASHLAMPITGKAELLMGMRKLAEDAGKRAALAAQASEAEGDGESIPRDTPRAQQVPVDIANAALALLGQDAIVAFGDRTRPGDIVRRFYRQALDLTFRAVDWPFARVYIAGEPTTLPPNQDNWNAAYTYPADIYDVRYIQRRDDGADLRFQVRRFNTGTTGRVILTNAPMPIFVCTAYISDPTQYPAEFITAAAARLAAMMALPLTGKADIAEGMAKNAEREGALAASTLSRTEAPDMGLEPQPDTYGDTDTHTHVANLALMMLGQPPIMAFSEHTKPGETCRRFYRQALGMALRAFDWPFARVVLVGQNVRASDVPNWKFAYDMPDCAALRYVIRSSDDEQPVRYQILRQGIPGAPRSIYTNEAAARFVVTGYVDEPADWPKDFTQFVAANLAQLIALPLTGQAEAIKAMSEAAETAGKMAIMSAGTEEGEQEGADATRDMLPVNSVPVEVANLALGLIGQDAILSFGERTKRANAARRFYALALRATLRGVDWPFARVYAAAVPSNAALIPGHTFAYAYPPNATCVRGFAKDYPTQYDVRFTLANGAVFTRRPAGTLIYTRWDIDPAQYDPEFTLLLAHELAALIAAPLTGKGDATIAMRAAAKMLRDKARADAANEDMGELDERVPDWLAARGIPSLVRQDREELMRQWGSPGRFLPPWGALPGSPQVNPTPAMITGPGPGSAILPAYIPGLTAPVEPTPQLLSSSDFWVESVGGRIERDGRLVVDDPSEEYIEPYYEVQEDN